MTQTQTQSTTTAWAAYKAGLPSASTPTLVREYARLTALRESSGFSYLYHRDLSAVVCELRNRGVLD